MKRLGTVVADLRHAAADLELLAARVEARPGNAHIVSQLRSAAADALSAANRAEAAL